MNKPTANLFSVVCASGLQAWMTMQAERLEALPNFEQVHLSIDLIPEAAAKQGYGSVARVYVWAGKSHDIAHVVCADQFSAAVTEMEAWITEQEQKAAEERELAFAEANNRDPGDKTANDEPAGAAAAAE